MLRHRVSSLPVGRQRWRSMGLIQFGGGARRYDTRREGYDHALAWDDQRRCSGCGSGKASKGNSPRGSGRNGRTTRQVWCCLQRHRVEGLFTADAAKVSHVGFMGLG
ncbi:proline-rich receptor-like protein kinase PERK2 [Iris pallida]|uniref:Proline-rich receptor-like protein kinase PERK2 n=1 Tax=Iris pallida TaxID=29817 RepID=A0AAX6FKS5_IRIPA|nr:proline-rich receptor-like protein kinase PERK2 [Iris pallida]